MTKNKSAQWLCAMLGCVFGVNVFAGQPSSATVTTSPQDALIRGFAKYQAGRVENLVLNEFVDDLVEEPSFKAFFPATSNAVANFKSEVAGKRLIPLLQEEFKNVDLVNLSLAAECVKSKGSSEEDKKDKVKMADIVLDSFKNKSSNAGPFAKQILAFCGLQPVGSDSEDLSIIDNTKAKTFIAKHSITANEDQMKKNSDAAVAVGSQEKSSKVTTATVLENIKKSSKTANFNQLIAFLESYPDVKKSLKEKPSYGKLKSAGLFLAGLSDASNQGDANAVAGVIADFVDEDAAYQRKRQDVSFSMNGMCKNKQEGHLLNYIFKDRLLLSSYYGISYGPVEGVSTVDNQWRAYGPVGLEYKLRASDWGVLGLNVAPFDLGAYITNELNGAEYEAKMKDIRAPSYFVSYSLKNKPVAFLLGHQKNLLMGDGQYHDVNFLAFAFDLPLYSLF